MNRAEFIIATIDHANRQHVIDQHESVRVLTAVAGLLNSGRPADKIDNCQVMKHLWKEVGRKWGQQS